MKLFQVGLFLESGNSRQRRKALRRFKRNNKAFVIARFNGLICICLEDFDDDERLQKQKATANPTAGR